MTEPTMRGLMGIVEGAVGDMQDTAGSAVTSFVARVRFILDLKEAFIFGSHARGDARSDSDVDVAIVLNGERHRLTETILRLSNIAYDVFAETSILIDAHPIWVGEWTMPSRCPNPALVESIKRDGRRL